jgi:hypothetical protein
LNNWQIIESQCFMLFWHLSLYNKLKLPSLIFTHIRSFEQRLSLIDKILVATFKAQTWPREEWKALLTRLKTAGGQRDRLVHYSVKHDPDDPHRITIEPPYFDYIRRHGPKAFPKGSGDHYMGAKELTKVMSSFGGLSADLERFADKLEPVSEKLQKAAAQEVLKPSVPQPNPGQTPR